MDLKIGKPVMKMRLIVGGVNNWKLRLLGVDNLGDGREGGNVASCFTAKKVGSF